MENIKTLNLNEIWNLIPVVEFVNEKEEPFALIFVLKFVIVANANHVNFKGHLFHVTVANLKEWWNVVKKEKPSNVEKSVKKD